MPAAPVAVARSVATMTIFKICTDEEWRAAEADGVFAGAAIDLVDGYIHFSTRAQVEETARRHFAGRDGLVLVAIDADRLGAALRWEPSRGGDLFPHLHGPLPTTATTRVDPLPRGESGEHVFPWA